MGRIIAIMLVIGLGLEWLACILAQSEEEYREIEEGLEDEWL